MVVEGKNKKSDSETSVLTRKTKGCCSDGTSLLLPRFCEERSRLFSKKLSKSLNELDLTCSKNSEIGSFSRKESRITFKDDVIRSEISDKTLFKEPKISDDNLSKFAKRCVTSLLMLNAWRKQKASHKILLEKMENLNEKLRGFEMQVYLLRQLLNAERNRVDSVNENVCILIQQLEKCAQEKEEIHKKSKHLENNVDYLSKYCCHLDGISKNQENTILTILQEAKNLESLLRIEQEKLKEMEAGERKLKEKIQNLQENLTEKTEENKQLVEANRKLQENSTTQARVWDEKMRTMKRDLKNALHAKTEEATCLSSALSALEEKLRKENEKNGLLAKTIVEKTNELRDTENKLKESLKRNDRWSGGGFKIKMASICAKIPVACICTVASLLLPYPSYRI